MNQPAVRPADVGRDLLVAVLAVETDLVTPEAGLAALHAWVHALQQPLIGILAEQRALPADARSRLDGIVAQYVETHGTVDETGRRFLIRRFVQLCRAMEAAETRRSLRQRTSPSEPVDVGRGTVWGGGSSSWRSPLPESALPTLESPQPLGPDPLPGRDEARANVYALGIVLYSLLTDQAPFTDADPATRQQRMAQGDLCPPRAVRPSLSPALEAICLKALAQAPAERYVSPSALANDLEHWLGAEPVAAYASPLRQRLRRWGQRHRRLATTATLLAMIVALTASAILFDFGRQWFLPGESQAARFNPPSLWSLDPSDRVVNRWLQSRDVLGALTTRALDDWLGDEPALSPEQQDFLKGALAYYNFFSQDPGEDPASRAGQADAFFHMGILRQRLGQNRTAEADYQQSQHLLQALVKDLPSDRLLQGELAQTHLNIGMLLEANGKLEDALAEYKQGLELYGRLNKGNIGPRLRMHIAEGHRRLALVLSALGRRQEAELALRKAPGFIHTLALPSSPDAGKYLRELVRIYDNLATLLAADGQNTEANEQAEHALTLQQRLVLEHPREAPYHHDLATLLDERAFTAYQHKDYSTARDRLSEALPEHQAALASRPGSLQFRLGLRAHLAVRVTVSLALGDHRDAAAAADGVLHLRLDPAKDSYNAARTLARCASLAEKDQKLSAHERQTLAKGYADRAMLALKKALAGGFKDRARLRKEPDFGVLRGRADFRKLTVEQGPPAAGT